MKAVFERQKFLHAFQAASSVVPSRSARPVLQCVKLGSAGESTVLIGTDLEVAVRVEVEGFQASGGESLVLPSDRFGAILRESSDDQLELESDGRRIVVRGKTSQFQLPSIDPDEYPDVMSFEMDSYHELPLTVFRELTRRTVFATDPESTRYALSGVLLETLEDRLVAVATDGRRLAKQEAAATRVGQQPMPSEPPVIPARVMQLYERILGEEEGVARVAASENDILVRAGRRTIFTRLLEGRFPRWRDVLPRREGTTQIELPVEPFHGAVRQAAIMTDKEHRGVEFRFGEGKVELAAHGGELGESRIELPIGYDGPAKDVKLDPRYVIDFLRVLPPEKTIVLHLSDPNVAVLFATDDDYAYVVMPLARDAAA